jgi:hypothetical protein
MEVANTPIYYDTATISAVKKFIAQTPVYTKGLQSNKNGSSFAK